SAQSYHRAIPVRRSQRAYIDRPEQGISSQQRPLLVNRYAKRRQRMLSYLSNQAPAPSPELDDFLQIGQREVNERDCSEHNAQRKRHEKILAAIRAGNSFAYHRFNVTCVLVSTLASACNAHAILFP